MLIHLLNFILRPHLSPIVCAPVWSSEDNLQSWFFPDIMRILGSAIVLGSVASAFSSQAVLPASNNLLIYFLSCTYVFSESKGR